VKTYTITDKELEILSAIERHGTLTDAARALGINVSTASQRVLRLKLRYIQAREFMRQYERWKFRLPKYLEA